MDDPFHEPTGRDIAVFLLICVGMFVLLVGLSLVW